MRKKRHELQRAYDASKAGQDTRPEERHVSLHSPLHSRSATELHSSPTPHTKPQPLKSTSATAELTVNNSKKSVTMTTSAPAVSATSMRSHLPQRKNDQISISRV